MNFVCTPGTTPVCSDTIACTIDFCNAATDSCSHAPDDAYCQDSFACNGAEKCNPGMGCVPGTSLVCNDGVACTQDNCEESLPGCKFVPNAAACSDGKFCNGSEKCDAMLGCQAGTPPSCNDGVPCTIDQCNGTSDSCEHTPDASMCSDQVWCNGTEVCDAALGCKAGPPPCPSDGIACTVDCNEAAQACDYKPTHSLCPSGQFCVPMQAGCVSGTPCSGNPECDDGLLCNGIETCDANVCKAGTPLDCDDAIPCTLDGCAEPSGTCTHTPNSSACSDGNYCTGEETCSTTIGCESGTPPDCSDAIPCTVDACDSMLGKCKSTPDDTACSDGKFCNGAEICDIPSQGCLAGTPVTCPDDGFPCTTESCDAVANQCVHTPNDASCGCGQSCVPGLGCVSQCTVAACGTHVYACGDCLDNDMDCRPDSDDPECLGPCDDSEDSLNPETNVTLTCSLDCYFDGDSGTGNDGCLWSHKCDPQEQGTPHYPQKNCTYEATMIGGTSCPNSQTAQCTDFCIPLTPNGCDCFGCCEVGGSNNWVFLGSLDYTTNERSCKLSVATDPAKCHPCTPVSGCVNPCEHCEFCIGETALPGDCTSQLCPAGRQLCGRPGQPTCPSGYYCITGCCMPLPT